MPKAGNGSKTENRLKGEELDQRPTRLFGDHLPIGLALTTGDVVDDPLHAAPGEPE